MGRARRDVPLDRRIPRWSALLLARLAQDRPSVLTRDDVAAYLSEIGAERDVTTTIQELVRLGWLTSSHLHGVWFYMPPGQSDVVDPYLDLRAWRAKDSTVVFALAGEAAAWHLGYLDRRFDGPIAMWLPQGARPPFGIRPFVSVVRLGWDREAARNIGPSRPLLRRRRLDLTSWAGGLPAFGPEALLVQLATRPGSFRPWADLVAHLSDLANDCEPSRLVELLEDQSTSAWQRAGYLLQCGGAIQHASEILARRPHERMVHVALGDGPDGEYSSQFGVTDRLVAPLLARVGKA